MPCKIPHKTNAAQVFGSSYSVLSVLVHFFAPMPEAPRGVPARKEMAEQDIEYTLHMHHCWTKKMRNLFQHAPPRDAESVSGNCVSLEASAKIVRQEINAAVTPMRSQLSCLQVTLGARMDQVENILHKHDLKIQKSEQLMADTMDQRFSNNVGPKCRKTIARLPTPR